jgi:glycosyltransferase involved in cell wall biosynthesis
LIGTCLETLRAQRGSFDLDVLVVDSGSTDATVEIARTHRARIAELSPGDFDYSKALNLGIAEVRGDLVVSLSAHAVPVEEDWLRTMIAPFDDPLVAGVSSRQVPWPNAPWHEVKRLNQVFGETRRTNSRDVPGEIPFSNAASVIRRCVWQEHPFTLPAVEDLEWAERVVAAGWEVVYEPGSAVYHSHSEGPRALALRLIDINRVRPDKRTRLRTLREAAGYLRRDARRILALDDPFRRKLAYLAELACTAWFYVADFSRAGTTAERRAETRT